MIIESIVGFGAFVLLGHVVDYRILKPYHFKKQKWDLNISCGAMDGGGRDKDVELPR